MSETNEKRILSAEEKKNGLFYGQCKLLETLLEHNAISKEQYYKSLHDMSEKMGFEIPDNQADC